MDNGVEKPNVKVTRASKISPEECARLNLDYCDLASINMDEWIDCREENILFIS